MKKVLSPKEYRHIIKTSFRGFIIEKVCTFVLLYPCVWFCLLILAKIQNSSADGSQLWAVSIPATIFVFSGFFLRFGYTWFEATDFIREVSEEEIEAYLKAKRFVSSPKRTTHTKPQGGKIYF